MHLNLKFNRKFDSEDLQWTFLRLQIAEWFGWPLDYIDNLPYVTVQEILAVRAGRARAREK